MMLPPPCFAMETVYNVKSFCRIKLFVYGPKIAAFVDLTRDFFTNLHKSMWLRVLFWVLHFFTFSEDEL